MVRVVGRIAGVVVLVALIAWPLAGWTWRSPGAEPESTTITDYRATYDVAADGRMTVEERLMVDFPVAGKHGIFQFFDHADETAPDLRRVPRDIAVRMDGEHARVDLSTEEHGRVTVARIGDPDVTLGSGEHTFAISYVVDDVLLPGPDGSRFYWNVVPGGWRQRIDRAHLVVRLPGATTDVVCAVGWGRTGGCSGQGAGSDRLVVTADGLAPNTPVTVRADLVTPVPPRLGETRPWSARWDPVLGRSVGGVVVIGILGLLALAVGGLASRRAFEATPPFPLMYAPPDGIGPAQAAYLLTEQVDQQQSFVATMMYAAERGAVDLQREGASWRLAERGDGWDRVDPVTSGMRTLMGADRSFTADPKDTDSGRELANQLSSLDRDVRRWARQDGYLVTSGLEGAGGPLVLLGAALALANALWNPFDHTLLSLVPGLFAVGALPLLLPGSATRRTAKGRDLWSRIGGFRRVLSTPSSKQRFDFVGRKELYTQYLPWAVAFGVADEWAAKYRTEMGTEPPSPAWLGTAYAGGQTTSYVNQMVGSFQQTVDSAISSYHAAQSASSGGSGFSGGFSGGGGGGGGGGGSW